MKAGNEMLLSALDEIPSTTPPQGEDWGPCVNDLIRQLENAGFKIDNESSLTVFALWFHRKCEMAGFIPPGKLTEIQFRMLHQITQHGETESCPDECLEMLRSMKLFRDAGIFTPIEDEAEKGFRWSSQGKAHLERMNKEKQSAAKKIDDLIRKKYADLEDKRKSGECNVSECYEIIKDTVTGQHGEILNKSKIDRALGKKK